MTISSNISGVPAVRHFSSNAAVQAAYSGAYLSSVVAERQRLVGIMGLPEAVGRESMRDHIMFNTSFSIEEARTMLGMAAKAKVQVNNLFAQAMSSIPNPLISVDSGDFQVDNPAAAVQGIVGAMNFIRGANSGNMKKGS